MCSNAQSLLAHTCSVLLHAIGNILNTVREIGLYSDVDSLFSDGDT